MLDAELGIRGDLAWRDHPTSSLELQVKRLCEGERPTACVSDRSSAAAVVAEASGLGFLTTTLLVDVVDVATAAILGSVGLDHVEIRRAAAAVWGANR